MIHLFRIKLYLCCDYITEHMATNKDLNRLKVILAEKKKSNLWLSKELGCSPTTVSKWCTNSSQPPLEMLMKITRLLDVELNDLVRYEELDKN